MSLGELTGGGLRGYWKLENANDSGPNGYNLTASGISYNSGRFTNAADFGSSGTTQYLQYSTNILSSTTPTSLMVSFWFKLNSTANTGGVKFLWMINTVNTATTGRCFYIYYSITSGTITVTAVRRSSIDNTTSQSFSANTTDWYLCVYRLNTDNTFSMIISNKAGNVVVSSNAGTGAGQSLVAVGTPIFSIGVNVGKTAPAWVKIDEFIVSESIYTEFDYFPNRSKYYQQARGFLI